MLQSVTAIRQTPEFFLVNPETCLYILKKGSVSMKDEKRENHWIYSRQIITFIEGMLQPSKMLQFRKLRKTRLKKLCCYDVKYFYIHLTSLTVQNKMKTFQQQGSDLLITNGTSLSFSLLRGFKLGLVHVFQIIGTILL